ncbi:hypothetical protein BH11MYX3_BH11MYX3_16750 [soil metagenome]
MQRIGFVVLAACGGSAAPAPTTPKQAPLTRPSTVDLAPADPIAVLAPAVDSVSWLVPGQAQLELDGPPIETPGGGAPIEVTVFGIQGNRVRVAVRLEHARFSLWTDRNRMFAVMRTTQRLDVHGMGTAQVTVNAGARVKRIGHKGAATNIRYFGALEVEGWVPDTALADAGPPQEALSRFPSGHRTLMVTPGSVIRSEPRWVGGELAVMANGYFLDLLDELEDGWNEVEYRDRDLSVRGFVSQRLPPGQVHRPRNDATTQPIPVIPNTSVASGTCLYARIKGDLIGYIVGDRAVDLVDAELGWYALSIDSPWGPLTFAARGPTRSDLFACAPVGSVPPSAALSVP